MTRPRQVSRPDPRVDDDATPPSGTPIYAPATPLDIVRDELRDLRARVGAVESRADDLEDWIGNTKTRNERDEKKAEKWGDSGRRVAEAFTVAVLVLGLGYALTRVACVPPPNAPPKVEVKP